MATDEAFSSEGARLITAERVRQVQEEGYTFLEDQRLAAGSMAMAAACYAADEPIYVRDDQADGVSFKDPWPWQTVFDKRPRGGGNFLRYDLLKQDSALRLRLLVMAGALLAAEIDKLLGEEGAEGGERAGKEVGVEQQAVAELCSEDCVSERQFPVYMPTGDCPRSVPWSFLAPHEEQVRLNHGDDLETMAVRHGLSDYEIVAVVEKCKVEQCEQMPGATLRLKTLLDEFERKRKTAAIAPDLPGLTILDELK